MDCGELGSAAWHPFSRWPLRAAQLADLGCWSAPEGQKPADPPVMRATKFELVINTQTAKTLAIDFPPACSLLLTK
jgi:hypothetical protein